MNKLVKIIKNSFFPIFLLSSLLPLMASEPFYESYNEQERFLIADAYLNVGTLYTVEGEEAKGRSFKEMAEQIYPGIQRVKPAFKEQEDMKKEAALTKKKVKPERPSGKEPAAVQYYFNKTLRTLFSENLKDTASLLSTRLYLPGFDQGIAKKDVLAYVKDAYDRYDLKNVNPGDLYNLKRLHIRKEGRTWIASIKLTPKGRRLFGQYVHAPWGIQDFYYREYRNGWRLVAINGSDDIYEEL